MGRIGDAQEVTTAQAENAARWKLSTVEVPAPAVKNTAPTSQDVRDHVVITPTSCGQGREACSLWQQADKFQKIRAGLKATSKDPPQDRDESSAASPAPSRPSRTDSKARPADTFSAIRASLSRDALKNYGDGVDMPAPPVPQQTPASSSPLTLAEKIKRIKAGVLRDADKHFIDDRPVRGMMNTPSAPERNARISQKQESNEKILDIKTRITCGRPIQW